MSNLNLKAGMLVRTRKNMYVMIEDSGNEDYPFKYSIGGTYFYVSKLGRFEDNFGDHNRDIVEIIHDPAAPAPTPIQSDLSANEAIRRKLWADAYLFAHQQREVLNTGKRDVYSEDWANDILSVYDNRFASKK